MTIAPENSALQAFYGTLPLMGAILLAPRKENKRVDDLKTALNKRIDDLHTTVTEGFKDVKERLGKLEERVSDLEKGLRVVRP
jgi:hypothetical protein